jgi:hypothetical protein
MNTQRKRFDDESCFNVSRKNTDVLLNCTDREGTSLRVPSNSSLSQFLVSDQSSGAGLGHVAKMFPLLQVDEFH